MSSKLAGQSWRIFVIMVIVFLAFATYDKYKNLPGQEPVHLSPEIMSKNISYNKGIDDYVDGKTVKLDGLLDIDTGKNEIQLAFRSYNKIKSIKGYCEVKGGYVKYEGGVFPFSGGTRDSWDEHISSGYTGQDEKGASPCTPLMSIPLNQKDLHKNMTFDVTFYVVYPKAAEKKNSFYNKGEELHEQYFLYIISEEEMKMKLDYMKWNRRGSQKVTVILLAALTLFLTGFVLFYKRR